MNVRGYERGYVNVNAVVAAYTNDNVAGCVDAYEKIFWCLLTKLNGYAIMVS